MRYCPSSSGSGGAASGGPGVGKAAIYLRSSKDRSDVSIAAQRRELQALAHSRELAIVAEYSDVVESAKDERRAGFQALLAELKHRDRAWDHLLLVDTSRLSRRRYMAEVFGHEAAKRGVTILYSKLPQSDPIADMVVVGVMRVFDELHSLMSREKGLAGMAENVRSGWRAGGRAPRGYRLKAVPTGAVRDGAPVTKTVLEVSPDAPAVGVYLHARAAGVSRRLAKRDAGLTCPDTSCIAMEWNALTYAGCLVWNQHNSKAAGTSGYVGGVKHRAREEWVIQPDAHEALITRDEAEALLARLRTSSRSQGRRSAASYLLGGMLQGPDGRPWHGNMRVDRRLYRIKLESGRARHVSADELEAAVLSQVRRDLQSTAFVRALVSTARKRHARPAGTTEPLARELAALEKRIGRTVALAAELEDPAPVLRQVEALERERRELHQRREEARREEESDRILAGVSEGSMRRLVTEIADTLVDDGDREALKDALRALAERIVLDPADLTCRVHYRVALVSRDRVVTPGGSEINPTIHIAGRRILIST